MLADMALAGSVRLGDAYFMAIGPAVIFLALIAWIVVTLTASRKQHRYHGRDDGLSHRGPVMGGVIEGSPSQRTRRDPAPSVTRREAMAHVEYGRAEEEAAREKEREEAARSEPARQAKPRRRFGLPKLH